MENSADPHLIGARASGDKPSVRDARRWRHVPESAGKRRGGVATPRRTDCHPL